MSSVRPWLELARISNLPTVWTNVLAGWLLAGGGWDLAPIAWLCLAGSLIYTGGMLLNDAADVRFDRAHRPERPIPSGRVSLGAVWTVGCFMIGGGALLAIRLGGASLAVTLALVAAVTLYDLYHKQWAGSVVVMAACRTLLYLVAGSAVTGRIDWSSQTALIMAAVALGGYVAGLSLVARHEAAKKPGSAGMVVGRAAMCLPFIGFFYSLGGEGRSLPGILVGLVLVVFLVGVVWIALGRMKTPPLSNVGRAVGLLLAAIPVVDGLAIAPISPWIALIFAGSLPLLLLWQRKIQAT